MGFQRDRVVETLKDILRIELPTDKVTVYAVDPKVGEVPILVITKYFGDTQKTGELQCSLLNS